MKRLGLLFLLSISQSLNARIAWVNPENKKDPRCDAKTGMVKPTLTTDTSMEFRNFRVPAPRATFKDRNGLVLSHDVSFARAAIWLEGGQVDKVKERFYDDLQKLNKILKKDLSYGEISKKIFEERRGSPIVFNEPLSDEEVATLKSANLPRLRVIKTSRRHYPQGPVFSHALGWAMADQTLSETYLFHPIVGRSGLESLLNTQASGRYGLLEVLRDSKNFELKMIFESEAVPTQEVDVGIDVQLQKKVYEAIKGDIKNGLLLVSDTQTGEIPVMLSLPTFDPSIFTPYTKKKEYDEYAADLEEPLANKIYRSYEETSWEKTSTCLNSQEEFDPLLERVSQRYSRLMNLEKYLPADNQITALFLLTLLQHLTQARDLTLNKKSADAETSQIEVKACRDFWGMARRRGSYYEKGEKIGLIKKALYYMGTTQDKRFNLVYFIESPLYNEKALLRVKKKIEKALSL